MTLPLVTVIVPVHDGERFLAEALESAFAQDYRPIEVVVVDDGSEDATGSVARSFDGVRYLRQARQGPAVARNAGVAASSGEFLAFLDHDDVWLPDKLTIQIGYLLHHPDVGCVLGRQELLLEPGVSPPAWLRPDRLFGDPGGIPFPSMVVRREAFDAVGPFDPTFRISEDTDWLIRCRRAGVRIEVLPHVVLRRRIHGSNLTHRAGGPERGLLRSIRAAVHAHRHLQPEEGPPSRGEQG